MLYDKATIHQPTSARRRCTPSPWFDAQHRDVSGKVKFFLAYSSVSENVIWLSHRYIEECTLLLFSNLIWIYDRLLNPNLFSHHTPNCRRATTAVLVIIAKVTKIFHSNLNPFPSQLLSPSPLITTSSPLFSPNSASLALCRVGWPHCSRTGSETHIWHFSPSAEAEKR